MCVCAYFSTWFEIAESMIEIARGTGIDVKGGTSAITS
jgi:hypothetical protein